MRSLNLDQLRALQAVVEIGSFTAAAKRLNLSQSAVSVQIRELEDRFGVQLVERVGKRAYATAAGRDLLAHAQRILAEAEQAEAAVRKYRSGGMGRVHLGTGPTALAYLLPPLLRQLHETHPDIELVVTAGTTQGIIERMRANVIDLGFTALPVDERDFEVTPVREDPMVAILPASDPDIPHVMRPADFASRRLILEYQRVAHPALSRAWLQAGGVEVRPAMEFDGIEAMKNAVIAGLGVSIVPAPAITSAPPLNSIVARPLDPPLVRTLGLIKLRAKPDNAALRLVSDTLMRLSNGPYVPQDAPAGPVMRALPEASTQRSARSNRQRRRA